MVQLSNKFNVESRLFYTLLFLASVVLFLSYHFYSTGRRPVFMFDKIEGEVIYLNKQISFPISGRRINDHSWGFGLQISNSKNIYICKRQPSYFKELKLGQQLELLSYKEGDIFFLVSANEKDGKVLIPYNSTFGNINFVVMLLSGFVTLSVFTLQTYQKRNRSIKRKKIS